MKIWAILITDQTARSVLSDLDLHDPEKLLVLSSVMKELTLTCKTKLY